jgi:hypothetical protein
MPYIITGAIADLQKKGMDIGLAGQGRAISVFMRPMEYEEFFVRFHRVGAAVSPKPACIAKYEAMELPELKRLCEDKGIGLRVERKEDVQYLVKRLVYNETPDGGWQAGGGAVSAAGCLDLTDQDLTAANASALAWFLTTAAGRAVTSLHRSVSVPSSSQHSVGPPSRYISMISPKRPSTAPKTPFLTATPVAAPGLRRTVVG